MTRRPTILKEVFETQIRVLALTLQPSRFILGAQYKELVGTLLSPPCQPFFMRAQSISLKIKLSVEELSRAKAQTDSAGLPVRFPLLEAALETCQAPLLQMNDLRTRDSLHQLGNRLLCLLDFRL